MTRSPGTAATSPGARRWRAGCGPSPVSCPGQASARNDPPRAMIRAHLRRSIGGGLGGPLRNLPQESVARAEPALEAEHLSLGGAISNRSPACHVRVFHFRAPALPAQLILGGGFGRGAKPPSEGNVQRVRLACGRRVPPCSWTLLIALARAFLRGGGAKPPPGLIRGGHSMALDRPQ